MSKRLKFQLCWLSLLIAQATTISGDERKTADSAGVTFFESKIRPVLAKHCYGCHSAQGNKAESGLALDSRHAVRTGGDRGPAVVPNEPDTSILLAAVSHADPDLEMPPNQDRLPDQVLADIRRWIEMGAPHPRSVEQPLISIDIAAGREFWAFRKPREHELPAIADTTWPRRDLDYFVLAKLLDHQLAPSADAQPAILLRRLYFDLVGLPPQPSELSAFLERVDTQGWEAALETEVDQLLDSAHFGERWGRHWLDVARYAESSGKDTNVTFPHAWRYRDYVIDSINADKPYDRFLVEQIAGDLLSHESDEQQAERMIATGFLALGTKGLNETNRLQFLADVVDEQIDTVTRAVLASSVACARCHDHKFDPFSMQDYYGLAGVFASTKTHFGTRIGPGNQQGGDLLRLPDLPRQLIPNRSIPAKRLAKLRSDLAALAQEKKDRTAAAQQARLEGKDPNQYFSLAQALRIIWRTGAIEGQLKTVDESGTALPLAMGALDSAKIIDAPLLERGEVARPGDPIPRAFPEVIDLPTEPPPEDRSGRLQLARWLTHPDHPLTARVMANRVWRHLVGAGIVRTVDNFGQTGERPSHPELLDHLALRFVKSGWSIKSLVREIVLSRTYSQGSSYDETAFQADPDNRLLWRANKRRLDAEAIRDAMLAVAGKLDRGRRRGSLIATVGYKPVAILAFDKRVPADLDGSPHRSVYLPVVRDRLPDALELFDFAEPSLVTGSRETTNVPLQALYLMNSPFVRERAVELAARLSRACDNHHEQIVLAFQLCFGRSPDDVELDLGRKYVSDQAERGLASEDALAMYCQVLFLTAEFRNVD